MCQPWRRARLLVLAGACLRPAPASLAGSKARVPAAGAGRLAFYDAWGDVWKGAVMPLVLPYL